MAKTEKREGIISVIKYEGQNNVFAWKHPIEDFNSGSQLIVHESQEAIFYKDGKALDLFGSGRYTLETQNIPLMRDTFKLPSNTESMFHAEVYYVNLVTQMGIKWGTDSKVRLFDPGSGLHIEIGACGSFNLRVTNSRKFLVKVVGTTQGFGQSEILNGDATGFTTGHFKSLIMNKVKANLARIIKEQNINILEIDEHLDTLSDSMRMSINEILDDYGMVMPEFFITTIQTPDDDPNFRRLKQQFADKTLKVREEEVRQAEAEAAQKRKVVEVQTEAQLKMVGAQGEAEALKIKAQAEADALKAKAVAQAEAYRMQAFAEADEMKAKGYTYQQETARQVGMEAMQNGITGGEGSGGSGLGDLAGLGVTLGAMGGVINMTKDAMSPIMDSSTQVGAGFGAVVSGQIKDGWDCPNCGIKNITSKFCPDCGTPKPVVNIDSGWNCPNCGAKGITSKFCPDCGTPKPTEDTGWTCSNCGTTGIKSKFCPECGHKKDEQ